MLLQMPAFLKDQVRGIIRKEVRLNRYIVAALATGFVVSILELACTGQVYLPTITLMVRQEGGKALAVFYLLLYNVCFILPLLVVFGVVYFGVSSRSISKLMESRVGTVKLALAMVFFILGGLLLWTVF